MTTVNDKNELAVFVCPDCNNHSVGDPAWLDCEGETMDVECSNCFDAYRPHLIVKFVKVEIV
jgi:transcription elongation factor Elf1